MSEDGSLEILNEVEEPGVPPTTGKKNKKKNKKKNRKSHSGNDVGGNDHAEEASEAKEETDVQPEAVAVNNHAKECVRDSTPGPEDAPLAPPSPVTPTPPSPMAAATPSPVAVAPPSPVAAATPSPMAAPPSPMAAAPPSLVAVAPPSPMAAAPPSPVAVAPPSPMAAAPPSPMATATPSPKAAVPPSPVAAATPISPPAAMLQPTMFSPQKSSVKGPDDAKAPSPAVQATTVASPTPAKNIASVQVSAQTPAAPPTSEKRRIVGVSAGGAAPLAISNHDSKNTTNVCQLLQLAAFKLQPLVDTVPYQELVRLRLEDGIDPTRREDYLTDPEFATVFGMDRGAFKALPAWKKSQKKKDVGLF